MATPLSTDIRSAGRTIVVDTCETMSYLEHPIFELEAAVLAHTAEVHNIPLYEPIVLPFGTFTERPSGWIGLTCKFSNTQQMSGYGEGATLPEQLFTDDSGDNIAQAMSEVTQNALRERRTIRGHITAIERYRFQDGGRHPTARMATEVALLDAAMKISGISMRDVLGIPTDMYEVVYGLSIGGKDTTAMIAQAKSGISQGAKKIKLKVTPNNADDVIDALVYISSAFPHIELMVDANGSFNPSIADHLDKLHQLDDMGLVLIEEPVSRTGNRASIDPVRTLRKAINFKTPICLDDCLATSDDCETVMAEGLAEAINIKPGRIGSFMRSLELISTAEKNDVQVMVGGMMEATPGRCMTTLLGALCATKGFTIPGDLSPAQDRLSGDLVEPDRQLHVTSNGGISLPHGLGWGY